MNCWFFMWWLAKSGYTQSTFRNCNPCKMCWVGCLVTWRRSVRKVFRTSDRWSDFEIYSRNEKFYLQQLPTKVGASSRERTMENRNSCSMVELSFAQYDSCSTERFAQKWQTFSRCCVQFANRSHNDVGLVYTAENLYFISIHQWFPTRLRL